MPRGFSLIEVVFALGICSFSLVSMLGLFTLGLNDSRDSEQRIEVANLASTILSTRRSLLLSNTNAPANLLIPSSSLTNAFGNVAGSTDRYITLDGTLSSVDKAAYRLRCRAGTNSVTGSDSALVYVMLSWPPQMDPSNPAAKYYEFISCIPLK
jgi:Tfp pilus assembly protein PilV